MTIVNPNYEGKSEKSKNEKTEKTKENVVEEYKCNFSRCNAVFSSQNKFHRHLKYHAYKRPFKCPIDKCNKAYTSSANLRQHLQIHTAEGKTFKCQYCFSNMSTKYNLDRHYKRYHNPK